MPYARPSDLPDRVRRVLPPHAERIYMEAFNAAYAKGQDDTEASKVAWAAVRNAGYTKNMKNGMWVKRQ